MDWAGARDSSFVFRRVKWPEWEEAEDFAQITGGSVELSALSSLKAAGTLSFKGGTVPDDGDLVRIYYVCNGEAHAIATLFCDVSEPTYTPSTVEGTLKCYSVLQVLSDDGSGRPYTAAAGTNAVALAVDIANAMGLRTNAPTSGYTLKSDHTFKSEDSWLTVVNWLLSSAGYASCVPDEWGTVQMVPYVEPTERDSSWDFTTGADSILYPSVTFTTDYRSSPNVVALTYEGEEATIWAESRNIDPASRSSIPNRKRRIMKRETVGELGGDTVEEMTEKLKAMSLSKLVSSSAEIQYASFKCAWVPIKPNDAITLEGVTGDDFKGSITNMRIDFTAAIPCAVEARRFVRGLNKTETEGGSY